MTRVAVAVAAVFPAVNQSLQIVPAWAGALPIVFYLLVWAPYRAWSRQADEVGSLRDQLVIEFKLAPSGSIDPRSGAHTIGVTVTT
jgi:hypothetical protein